MASVVLNGVTYTDDSNGSTGMGNGGHRARFVPCLANFVIEAETQLGLQHASRDAADASEAAALASELAAEASALSALNAPGTNATSTTNLTIGLGSKSLTIQTGKALVVGQFVSIAYTTDATKWMHGVITAYDSGTGSLTVNVTTFAGSGTYTTWSIGLSSPIKSSLIRSARTSNTMLDVGDSGTLIDITSGTFSQTFAAAATIGEGWWCYIRNRGTGTVTLDPNASELIGGVATLPMAIGDVYLVQCDGTGFNAVLVDRQTFSWGRFFSTSTNAATFTVPAGVFSIRAYLFGAGGKGASVESNTIATGGGGGSCGYGTIPTTPGTVFAFGISGGDVTLKVGTTLYLDANSGGNGGTGAAGTTVNGGLGGVAGVNGVGLGIANSGSYAGGNGGSSTATGTAYGSTGGGSSGSPLGVGGRGGGFSHSSLVALTGGGGWGGNGGDMSVNGISSGGGVGGSAYANYPGGAGGAASVSKPGYGREINTLFTDPLLEHCTGRGDYPMSRFSVSALPGAGGSSGSYPQTGGFGGGGGAGAGGATSYGGIAECNGGFGGGAGASQITGGSVYGASGGLGGGGGSGVAGAAALGGGAGGAACVVIFY